LNILATHALFLFGVIMWISDKDSLPATGVYVLTYCEDGVDYLDRYIICCIAEDGKWCDVDYYDVSHISHWMPLPEPPKRNKS
jgi:hypothetical protein